MGLMKGPIRNFLVFSILSLPILTLLYLTSGKYRLGITPDSVDYLAASKSFLSIGRFVDSEGSSFTHWPPLFPVILSAIRFSGFDTIDSMTVINGLLWGGTAVVTLYFAYYVTQSILMAILAGILVSVGAPLMFVTQFLFSEPLFTLLLVSALFVLTQYLDNQKFYYLIMLGVVCALISLQRYAGLTLVITTSFILLLRGGVSIRTRLKSIVIFGVTSCLPIGLWIIRNLTINGTMAGERYYSLSYLLPSTKSVLTDIGAFFIPQEYSFLFNFFGVDFYQILAFLIAIFILSYSFYTILFRSKSSSSAELVLSSSIIIYVIFIVYALLSACCSTRFLSPIYPAAVLLFVNFIYKLKIEKGETSFYYNACLVFLVCSLIMNTSLVKDVANNHIKSGVGITGKDWISNKTIKYLNTLSNKDKICIFTNSTFEIRFLTNISCVRNAVKMKLYYVNVSIDTHDEVVNQINEEFAKKNLFVWIDNVRVEQYRNIDSLQENFDFKNIFSSNDGKVYEIYKSKIDDNRF